MQLPLETVATAEVWVVVMVAVRENVLLCDAEAVGVRNRVCDNDRERLSGDRERLGDVLHVFVGSGVRVLRVTPEADGEADGDAVAVVLGIEGERDADVRERDGVAEPTPEAEGVRVGLRLRERVAVSPREGLLVAVSVRERVLLPVQVPLPDALSVERDHVGLFVGVGVRAGETVREAAPVRLALGLRESERVGGERLRVRERETDP